MKKVLLILGLLFLTVTFTSCTDLTEDVEEIEQTETKSYSDKDEEPDRG